MTVMTIKKTGMTINQQIALLQDEVERKLSSVDSVGEGSSVLSWPVEPLKGISALFHDKSYPFRHLFEHPGIDLPVQRDRDSLRASFKGFCISGSVRFAWKHAGTLGWRARHAWGRIIYGSASSL